MPESCSTLSSSRFSSNWNPYWNPEQPPPCTKMRSGLPSESGIVFAKYLTFSTAASVSARSGFASEMPVGSEPVGGDVIVEDIRAPFYLGSKQRRPTSDSIIPCHPERSEGLRDLSGPARSTRLARLACRCGEQAVDPIPRLRQPVGMRDEGDPLQVDLGGLHPDRRARLPGRAKPPHFLLEQWPAEHPDPEPPVVHFVDRFRRDFGRNVCLFRRLPDYHPNR